MTRVLQSIRRSRHWQSGLVLILLVTLARVAYLVWLCPYTLIEDEAHYWEWSRRLELSYYSKGPGIAWVIRAATGLFGTHEWSVRLPAVVFGALGAWCAAGLTRDVCAEHGDGPAESRLGNAGLYGAAVYFCMPAFWVLGVLVTIDGPYLACWVAACWAAWRAQRTGSLSAWGALGLALAAGFLFKYTILLLVPGLVIAGWVASAERRAGAMGSSRPAEGPKPAHSLTLGALFGRGPGASGGRGGRFTGPVLAVCCAALGLVPVLIWNARHGWITVGHLLGHLGVEGGDVARATGESYTPLWTLELLGTQVALAGPAMLLAVYACACARREREARPGAWRGARFLACCGLPVLVFYVLVSFVAEPEGNWPIAAWVSAAPLGAMGVVGVMPEFRRRVGAWRDRGKPGARPHMHRVMAWRWTLGVGVIVALGFGRADLLARIPLVGTVVPRGRLMFADVRANDAARILGGVRAATGLEPFVMAQHYGRTSQLAYYLPGRPTVYCAGAYMEGPRKQYDLWPETDLSSPEVGGRLAGRPALLVGGRFEQWVPAFDRVEEVGQLEGEHKRGRLIYIGYGYRGFPETRAAGSAGRGGREWGWLGASVELVPSADPSLALGALLSGPLGGVGRP